MKLNSCWSLVISFLWEIVSYALDRSTYIASVGSCSLVLWWRRFTTDCSASVVLEFGLNAYCVDDRMLC